MSTPNRDTPHAGDALDPSDVRFITRTVSAEEIAAVTAVLSAVAEVQEQARRLARPERNHDAWMRSQHPLREYSFASGGHLWRTFQA